MILIADSGSTNTTWCLVEKGEKRKQLLTKGINPFFQSEAEIGEAIRANLLPEIGSGPFDALYFYGAGCTPEKTEILHQVLTQHLPLTGTVEIAGDMLGAARALCGNQSGIACILGTGSNSCLYDGKTIVSNVSPLGFILGDEGSGACLGKLLVGNLLKNQLTPGLKEQFLTRFNLTPAEILDRVYRQPFPNRFLAGLSPFLAQHLTDPGIRQLVLDSFLSFLRRNVMQYPRFKELPVHFTGSVAYHYKEILTKAAQQSGITLGHITQSPMEGLIAYHTQKQEKLT